jgi:peptidoglycan/LPS O-acetylase OafA/YrhL
MTVTRATDRAENRVLNLLRSLSAFAVVLGHVRLLFIQNYSAAPHTPVEAVLYAVTSLGSEAVIVFFVLSGYFVGGGVVSKFRRNAFSWFDYGSSRLTRLWLVLIPALLLTLLIDVIGQTVFGHAAVYQRPGAYGGMNLNPTLSPLAFLGNVAFLQGLHVPIYGTNNPLWSLAYEAWYYLMFPAIMALLWRGQPVRKRIGGGLLIVVGVVVSGPTVLLLFPCWLLGALVAAYRKQLADLLARVRPHSRSLLRGFAAVATALAIVFVRLAHLPSPTGAWLIAVTTGVLVALFVTDVEWRGALSRLLSVVSRTAHSSYSLYAIHMPIVVIIAAWAVPDPAFRTPMTALTLAMCIGIVLGIWVLSYLFARVTEMRTDQVKDALNAWWRTLRISAGRA